MPTRTDRRSRPSSRAGSPEPGPAPQEPEPPLQPPIDVEVSRPPSRNIIRDLERQMPKLNQNNFIAWNKALLNVEYFANWDRDLIDMGQTDDSVWDPDAEEPSEKRRADRRNAFALIRLTVSQELHHLLTGITPGDVKALYKKLYRRFCRLTAGAIQGLKKELASFTMASSGKTVEV